MFKYSLSLISITENPYGHHFQRRNKNNVDLKFYFCIFITISITFSPNSFFLKKIEVQLIYNVVLVSGVQQSDSVIHIYVYVYIYIYIYIYIYVLFQIIFPYRLLQEIEFSGLYSRSLLIIYFVYNSVYLLIPNS